VDTDLLFATPEGPATFPRKAWEKALRDSEVANFRFHDLRHSCASYLAMAGATIREIQEILGHKSLQMTMRYSHLSDQHLVGVADRMAEKFLGQVS
jgi:integrase